MTITPFDTATDLAAALTAKTISSVELLDMYLARIERHNPALNAVITLDVEGARAEARRADEERARGEIRGPLHGLPMTVKDSFETAGMRTAVGAPPLADHVPTRDADAVARLRAAGAVIFGKTNLPTFAMDIQSYNPLFGTTHNPWDTTRTPGGSSGGAAAAVAVGFTSFELGSDIGGSIRIPSAFCGVWGHKPTHGIVSPRGHIPGPPGSLAQPDIAVCGPIARSADDLERALDILAGPEPARSIAWRLELPPPRRTSLAGYRIAAWLDDPAGPVDASVRRGLESTVDAIRRAGGSVNVEARPGFTLAESSSIYIQLLYGVAAIEMPDEQFAAMVQGTAHLSPDDQSIPAQFLRALTQRKRDWNAMHERRERLRVRWDEFFSEYDAVLCPVMPVPAFPHDQSDDMLTRTLTINGAPRPYMEGIVTWAGLAGVSYLPSTAVPIGRTPEGLPLGLQVIGPYLGDRTTLDLARRIGELTGGYTPPPAFR